MAKVITFSRVFPAYHPKAGEPTYFMEKIWRGLPIPCCFPNVDGSVLDILEFDKEPDMVKHHTIRAGHRWKVGDWFSPRVWSGKPYHSKQIQFAPDIQIKKVFDFKIVLVEDGMLRSYEMQINGKLRSTGMEVFTNDGLTYNDFCDWFKMDSAKKDIHFDGQIICWNENIDYLLEESSKSLRLF
jgi:hypothetical protein